MKKAQLKRAQTKRAQTKRAQTKRAQTKRAQTKRAQTKRVSNEESPNEESEARRCPPFVVRGSALHSVGLHPLLRPVLGSTSLLGVSRTLSKGGVPHSRPRHPAHPPIGSERPRPLPFTPAAEKQAEKSMRHRNNFFFPSLRSMVSKAETVVVWTVEDGVRQRG